MQFSKKAAMVSVSAVLAAVALSGCAKKEDPQKAHPIEQPIQQTTAPTVVETEMQPQTQATVVQKQTEPKMASPKDVLVRVQKTDRSGSVQGVISTSVGDQDIEASFQTNSSAIGIQDSSGNTLYSDKDTSGFYADGEWEKINADYVDIFSGLYKADFVKTATIDGTDCYKYTRSYDDTVSSVAGLLGFCSISDYITGTVDVSYYVDPNTNTLVRVDAETDFQGQQPVEDDESDYDDEMLDETEMDGENAEEQTEDVMGSITAVFLPTSEDDVTLNAPVIKDKIKEPEKKEEKPSYSPGTLSADTNLYQNSTYGIQIQGGDVFTFDAGKTDEMQQQYEAKGNTTREEAYASGSGVLLNIISKPKTAEPADMLTDYLTESQAEGTAAGQPLTVGDVTFETATAKVNGAPVKAYAAAKNGQTLIVTLFYQADTSVQAFESCLYSMSDDPFWEEDTWDLDGHQVTTPKGYSITYTKSSDTFAEFTKGQNTLNVFLFSGRTIDDVTAAELESNDTTTKESVSNEQITLDDGSVMTYLILKNTQKDYVFYSYEGLLQRGDDVIEMYVVGQDDKEDLKQTFTDFAAHIADDTEEGLEMEYESEVQPETTEVQQSMPPT